MASTTLSKINMTSEVAIIGHGIVAMTMALALIKNKRDVQLFSNPVYQPKYYRQFAIGKKSIDFLKSLGVSLQGIRVNQFNLYSNNETLKLNKTTYPLCHIISEKELCTTLQEQLNIVGHHTVKYHNAIEWKSTQDSHASFYADNQIVNTKLVIAADGAQSNLSQQLHINEHRTDFPHTAVVASVKVPSLANDVATQWFFNDHIIALLPTGHHFFSLIWSTASPPPLSAKNIKQTLEKKINFSIADIDENSISSFPIRARRRCVKAAPRVAIIGDAAQVIHPIAGQGLNLGIKNCSHLMRCLRSRRDIGCALGLAAYASTLSYKSDILHILTSKLSQSEKVASLSLRMGQLPGIKKLAIAFANA